MGTKKRPKSQGFDENLFADFDGYDGMDDYDDDLTDVKDLSKDFYSTDWEDPSGSESRFSTRRRIERRNDLIDLCSQFDDLDPIDLGVDW